MTDTTTPTTRTFVSASGASYVEWSAIFAGAVVASAIIVLMTAFGSAIGLPLVSPYHGPSPALFYVALALSFTWITVSSFVAGRYVTGRLRRPIDGATQLEVHVRDGAHGRSLGARGRHRNLSRNILAFVSGHDIVPFVDLLVGQIKRDDFAAVGVDANMEFAPRTALRGPMLFKQPFAGAAQLQPRVINNQVQFAGSNSPVTMNRQTGPRRLSVV